MAQRQGLLESKLPPSGEDIWHLTKLPSIGVVPWVDEYIGVALEETSSPIRAMAVPTSLQAVSVTITTIGKDLDCPGGRYV